MIKQKKGSPFGKDIPYPWGEIYYSFKAEGIPPREVSEMTVSQIFMMLPEKLHKKIFG